MTYTGTWLKPLWMKSKAKKWRSSASIQRNRLHSFHRYMGCKKLFTDFLTSAASFPDRKRQETLFKRRTKGRPSPKCVPILLNKSSCASQACFFLHLNLRGQKIFFSGFPLNAHGEKTCSEPFQTRTKLIIISSLFFCCMYAAHRPTWTITCLEPNTLSTDCHSCSLSKSVSFSSCPREFYASRPHNFFLKDSQTIFLEVRVIKRIKRFNVSIILTTINRRVQNQSSKEGMWL